MSITLTHCLRNLRQSKKNRIGLHFQSLCIHSQHFDLAAFGFLTIQRHRMLRLKKRIRKFRTQCAMAFRVSRSVNYRSTCVRLTRSVNYRSTSVRVSRSVNYRSTCYLLKFGNCFCFRLGNSTSFQHCWTSVLAWHFWGWSVRLAPVSSPLGS